ncbi:uncharacterized protein SPPG_05415 [Spizellomyces punctatus DAOM BR117]|uniref:Uncharacterized protein n=1 Tax=Spizellomyces punctatus (strain DAOM BR117) TaxID=645134 RepID=A0A0L0HEI7_SPIPD|nr:uncharacterized protein SPPG_05415 [Spizellomyces punctatus DAOM BR117]KNC99158.1 hypothetical protein SPPG_05415 [Spizellomyces punctatus DAOM BR117]|eukprot:XP_016607198.1 hypothetical protein SPPG_05415 [Spizellomyces punctatus DAOM BR117]
MELPESPTLARHVLNNANMQAKVGLADKYKAKLAARRRGTGTHQTKDRHFAIKVAAQPPSPVAVSRTSLQPSDVKNDKYLAKAAARRRGAGTHRIKERPFAITADYKNAPALAGTKTHQQDVREDIGTSDEIIDVQRGSTSTETVTRDSASRTTISPTLTSSPEPRQTVPACRKSDTPKQPRQISDTSPTRRRDPLTPVVELSNILPLDNSPATSRTGCESIQGKALPHSKATKAIKKKSKPKYIPPKLLEQPMAQASPRVRTRAACRRKGIKPIVKIIWGGPTVTSFERVTKAGVDSATPNADDATDKPG